MYKMYTEDNYMTESLTSVQLLSHSSSLTTSKLELTAEKQGMHLYTPV
jgi:hypothetical protein